MYINKCPACMNGLGGDQAYEEGQLMGCTTNNRPGHSTHGMEPKHAYSILGMYDFPERGLQLIKVPWGPVVGVSEVPVALRSSYWGARLLVSQAPM